MGWGGRQHWGRGGGEQGRGENRVVFFVVVLFCCVVFVCARAHACARERMWTRACISYDMCVHVANIMLMSHLGPGCVAMSHR